MGKSTMQPLNLMASCFILAAFYACSPNESDLRGNWKFLSEIGGSTRSYAVGVSMDTDGDGTEDIAYYGLGWNGTAGSKAHLADWWSFDPSVGGLGTHTKLASFPGGIRQGAVAFVAAGKVYVGTGYNGETYYKDFWAYDPAANAWAQIPDLPVQDEEEEGRYEAVAFSINGIGYVGTGYSKSKRNDGSDDFRYNNDFYSYDPATGWSNSVPAIGEKRRDAVAFVIKNEAYLCTGRGSGGDVGDFFKYSPASNSWTKLAHIYNQDQTGTFDDHYIDIMRYGGVAWAAEGMGYLATGSGNASNKVWQYNPTTDRWQRMTNFEGNPRWGAIGFFVGDWGYLLTGTAGAAFYSDIWLFQPNAEKDRSDNAPY